MTDEPIVTNAMIVALKRSLGYGPSELNIDAIDVYDDVVVFSFEGQQVAHMALSAYDKILVDNQPPQEDTSETED